MQLVARLPLPVHCILQAWDLQLVHRPENPKIFMSCIIATQYKVHFIEKYDSQLLAQSEYSGNLKKPFSSLNDDKAKLVLFRYVYIGITNNGVNNMHDKTISIDRLDPCSK